MTRFYRIDEANGRLEELRPLLEQLRADRDAIAVAQRELTKARTTNGSAGKADEIARRETEVRRLVAQMQKAVEQIEEWGITLRDIGSGLIDFPALANGRPIWLCWRLGEPAVEWWHENDRGFDARKPLSELS